MSSARVSARRRALRTSRSSSRWACQVRDALRSREPRASLTAARTTTSHTLHPPTPSADGSIDVHTARDGRLLQTIAPAVPAGASPKASGLPVTCLRWRPASSTGGFRITDATTATRNVLLAAGSDGSLRHIHATSGRVLSTLYEPDTQLYACDYRPDGGAFASAGNAKVVRVYDEETRALKVELSGGVASASAYVLDRSTGGVASSSAASLSGASGHNNRIFAVAWHPTDENCIASAGWDNTVQIWDVRAGMAVRSIFGPHLGGDGLVFSADGTLLITASWRANDTLQVRASARAMGRTFTRAPVIG